MKSKKNILLGILFALSMTTVAAGAAACGNKEQTVDYGESGVYYVDIDGAEYTVSLAGNNFALALEGVNEMGAYAFDGTTIRFLFAGSDAVEGTLVDGVLKFKYKDQEYIFLKKTSYTVTFSVDGGSEVEAQKVINGRTATKPVDPTKEGYHFIGWYADDTFDTPYRFLEPVKGNLTIYARYAEEVAGQDEYEVQFYAEGETLEPMTTVGGKLYELPTPEKEGFAGWWLSDTNDGAKLTSKYDGQLLTADTTLFAVYEETEVRISVNSTGVEWNHFAASRNYTLKISRADGTTVENKSVNSNSEKFDFSGVDAGEYVIEVSGEGKSGKAYYMNKALARVSGFSVANSNVLLFHPVKNAEKYILTVTCGTEDHIHLTVDNGTSTYYDFSQCDMRVGGIVFTVRAEAKGYASSSATYVYEQNLDAVKNVSVNAAGELVWDRVENAMNYIVEINGKKISVGMATSYPLDAYTGELKLKVYAEAKGYNGSESEEISHVKATLASPSGLTVIGNKVLWTASENAKKYEVSVAGHTAEVTDTEYEIPEELLQNSVNSYEIRVRAIGEEETSASAYTSIVAGYRGMTEAPTYAKGMLHWQPVIGAVRYGIRVNGGRERTYAASAYAFECKTELTKAGTNKIEIRSYNQAGDATAWMSVEVEARSIILYFESGDEEAVLYRAVGDALNLPTASREGFEFAGWYNVPNGKKNNGKEYKSEDVLSVWNDLSLYACWTSKSFDVTLKADGNAQDFTEQVCKVYYEESYTLPVPKSADNEKVFGGWYDKSGGKRYTDGNGKSITTWLGMDANTDFYPVWIDILTFEELTDGTGYVVRKGEGIDYVTEITIPEMHNDKPVKEIRPDSFTGCTNLLKVNIPDTIVEIYTSSNGANGTGSAFRECRNLTDITLYPAGKEGHEKFYDSDEGVLLHYTMEGDWEIAHYPYGKKGVYRVSEKVTKIPTGAFRGQEYLTGIVLPKSVRLVDDRAFYGCKALESVYFEDGDGEAALTLGKDLFYNCSELTSVTLPARLDNFSADMITTTTVVSLMPSKLTTIDVHPGGEKYSSKEGVLCDGAGTTLIYAPIGLSGSYTVPMGIRTIAAGAFKNCTKITELAVAESVELIGQGAFSDCTGILRLTFQGMESSMGLTISEEAFYGCSGIKEVTLPANLQKLEKYAFGKTSSLSTVRVNCGENAEFQEDAFLSKSTGGGGLTLFPIDGSAPIYSPSNFESFVSTIYIGEKMGAVGISAVFGTNVSKIEIDGNNSNYSKDADGVLYNKDKTELLYYPNGLPDNFAIPSSVKKISARAFRNRPTLTEITIHSGVEEIGANAFEACQRLQTVRFEDGNAELAIGANAFLGCTRLQNVTLPTRLRTIGSFAFSFCQAFTEIEIPEGVTAIAQSAFDNCYLLESVSLPSTLETLGEFDKDNADIKTTLTVFAATPKLSTLTVAEGNRYFAAEGNILYGIEEVDGKTVPTKLYYCPTSTTGNIIIPNSVTKIWAKAFNGSKITGIEFSGTITSLTVGDQAFANAKSLQSVELPKGLKEISESMFMGCTGLVSVKIPNTVNHIHKAAFSGCTKLSDVIFGEEGETFENLIFGDSDAKSTGIPFYNCTSLKEVVLPEGTTEIGKYGFYAMKKIQSITLPSTLKSLPENCFMNTTALKTVIFADGSKITGIPKNAFSGSGLQSIVLPQSVSNFGVSAFKGTKLTTVTLPASIKELPQGAFQNCTKLKTVVLENGCKLETIKNTAFAGCSTLTGFGIPATGETLTKIVIPESVTAIGEEAFDACVAIEEIVIVGDNELTIGEHAFRNCRSMTAFTCRETEKRVVFGNWLFTYCKNLETVTVWDSVENLGMAINQCKSIKTLTVNTSETGNKDLFVSDDGIMLFKTDKMIVYSFGQIDVGGDGVYRIPDGVTVIGERAFIGQRGIKKLIIPASVTTIGAGAFAGCGNLEEVVFEANSEFTALEASVFENCVNLKKITLPQNLRSIGEYAFATCASLKTVSVAGQTSAEDEAVLPTKATSIGAAAFMNCSGLEKIALPEGTETVGAKLFMNCVSLADVRLPASMMQIGEDMFSGCKSLKTIDLSKNNNLSVIAARAFYQSGLQRIAIPDSVEYMGTVKTADDGTVSMNNNAQGRIFYDCTELERVTFGGNSNLKGIGQYSFTNCSALTNVQLPTANQIAAFGWNMFQNCTSLTHMVLPQNLVAPKYVTYSAFNGCTSLQRVEIFAPIKELENGAFNGCVALESVTLPSGIESIGERAFKNCKMIKTVPLDTSVLKSVGNYAFLGSGLETAQFSAVEMSIGGAAFRDCKNLTRVEFLETVTLVSNVNRQTSTYPEEEKLMTGRSNAFYGCTALKEVSGSAFFTNLPGYTFYGCESLESLDLSGAVTPISSSNASPIGYYAFYGCKSLESVVFPDSGITQIPSDFFEGCTALKEVVIPDGVTTIYSNAFRDSGITEFEISKSITTIGTGAFGGCKNLKLSIEEGNLLFKMRDGMLFNADNQLIYCPTDKTSVTLLDGETVNAYAFYGCEALETVVLPESTESIEANAFYGSGIRYMAIPKGVTTIGVFAFANCKNLTRVYEVGSSAQENEAVHAEQWVLKAGVFADSGITKIRLPENFQFKAGGGLVIGGGASESSSTLQGNNMITEVVIPEGVTEIGASFFWDCSSITSFVLPSTLKTIGSYAFSGTGISSIVIPESVTSLGSYAFANCPNLVSVEIQANITTLATQMFVGCPNLENVILPDTITTFGQYLFHSSTVATEPPTKLKTLNMPKNLKKLDLYSFYYCTGLETLEFYEGLESFPTSVFQGCTSLRSVNIPSTVTSIGQNAFASCSSLESLYIPETVTSIGNSNFMTWTSDQTIYFEGTFDDYVLLDKTEGVLGDEPWNGKFGWYDLDNGWNSSGAKLVFEYKPNKN